MHLDFPEILKHRVDHLESLVNLFSHFGTCQDNLARYKDEQHNLGLDHAINQTGEQLRLIGAKVVVTRSKTFETDRKLDVAGADNVLNLEIRELGVEAELLDDTGIFARGQLGIVFRLGTSDNHLAGREDEGSCLGLTNTHNDGGKTLWVVFGVSCVQSDRLQVQSTVEVDGSHDVLQSGRNATGALGSCRRCGGSCRSHPVPICSLLTVGSHSLAAITVC